MRKKIILIIIKIIIINIILYSIFAFILWELNPKYWEDFVRFIFSLLSFGLSSLLVIWQLS